MVRALCRAPAAVPPVITTILKAVIREVLGDEHAILCFVDQMDCLLLLSAELIQDRRQVTRIVHQIVLLSLNHLIFPEKEHLVPGKSNVLLSFSQ